MKGPSESTGVVVRGDIRDFLQKGKSINLLIDLLAIGEWRLLD